MDSVLLGDKLFGLAFLDFGGWIGLCLGCCFAICFSLFIISVFFHCLSFTVQPTPFPWNIDCLGKFKICASHLVPSV